MNIKLFFEAIVKFILGVLIIGLLLFIPANTINYWNGFWQMTIILWIMGLFDRFFIDWYWVGHTKAWVIPKTEDLQPYIPTNVLIRKWVGTIIGFPIIAAIIAGIMTLI